MSKDPFSVRIGGRSNSKSSQVESNENEFENALDSLHFPPQRTPLNTIPDPSQCQGELQEAIRGGHKRIDSYPSELTHIKGIGNVGTPTSRVTGKGKSHSDPNSAQSTPSRSIPRASNVGACTGPRPPLHNVAKGNSSSRVHRAISISTVNSDPLIEVPYFELVEDPLFWKDHNVQVLIRIRPLSNAEKALQGYGQCLKQESEQTLLWLGHPETRFTFDHIACETISQEKLFRVAGLPMVENCMSGYNSCMFAYGQTGSGKTYTMMGEIDQMDCNFNEDCGITPRIFEYLFSRIIEEEENRRHERLKYICKCSFLEIYNEQITDLLEPSSTNLQLREDLKKGVYVENLREYNVRTVDDVVELLLQGAANRKISATHMNSESSRSHSVFTCVIESSWEKDSMTHLRFGRLNLVDLAGSERQKSSGAEGDRLKEAANINKSLSTLGLVIMSLVDLAHGKHRHVPYRDSRLTFLLQDSLGGNSKTTIIANVSPSICSANETLSTLKFAQRAKLIQNNAKVNEDASGDVIALQKQIHQLKGQLSLLMEHHCTPRSLSPTIPIIKQSTLENFLDGCNLVDENDQKIPNGRKKKMKYSDAILIGALRREKAAESEIRKLEAEIEQINHFASQREEDLHRTKMLLRFREEKIKRLELLADGIVSDDNYLMDENNILKEEIQLLQAKIDRNPELTRFALENIKLIEQLRSFQDFCEHGERETLIAEVSELRDQLLETLEGNFQQLKIPSTMENQDEATSFGSDSGVKSTSCNELEHSVSGNQMNPNTSGESYFQHRETQTELMKAMEQEQVCLIEELELMREENSRLRRILSDKDTVEDNSRENMLKLENPTSVTSVIEDTGIIALQTKLAKLSKDLEEAQLVNNQFVKDHESQLSQDQQRELVREEAETETTNTILHLQDEVTALQSELQERLCSISEDNMRLRKSVAAKEEQIKSLSSEWERAILELTSFLMDGSKSLSEASNQIESIVCLFPQINVWVGEHVERAAKVCVEKEETLALLQKSLEDAQKLVLQMEQKLNSLKGAAMALAESKQPENDISTREAIQLTTLLDDQINKAEKHANAGLLVAKGLSDEPNHVEEDTSRSIANDTGNRFISKMESTNTSALQDIEIQLELASLGLLEAHNDINASCSDAEMYISALQADIQKTVSLYRELVEDFVNNVCEIRKNLGKLKVIDGNFGICITEIKPNHEIQQEMLHQIRDELAKTNERLNVISACLNTVLTMHHCPIAIDDLVEEGHSNASSTSDSSLPIETVTLKDILNKSSSGCYYQKHEMVTDGTQDKEAPGGSTLSSEIQKSEKSERVINNLTQNQTTVSCLRKEFKKAYNSFIELNAHLASLLNDKETQDCSEAERVGFLQSLAITNENVQHMCSDGVNQPKTVAVGCGARELIADKKTSPGSSFFTKLEEAHTTMKEADYMLNALMIANKNAEELSTMWKQAGEELMVEKAKLLEEIEQLKSSIHLKNEENEVLQEQIQYSFKELADSVYSLEGSVVHVQREVEQTSQILCSDSLTLAKDVLHCICNTRSAMEQVLIDALGHNFASFVLHQCHIGDFFRKFRSLSMDAVCNSSNLQEGYLDTNNLLNITRMFNDMKVEELGDQTTVVRRPEVGHLRLEHDDPISENLELKKELQRKDVLLKGLLFDFSLLQESASTKKDIEDESGKLIVALSQLQHELQMKTSLLDKMLVQHKELESRLADTEAALAISNSDLEQVKGTLATFTDQNTELMVLLKDLYLMKSATEEQLEEQKEIIGSLEKEILHLTSESEKQLLSAKREMEDHTRRVISERDQLLEHVQSLQDRLAMAYALVDENEAIAVEARQVSETSKLYAEEKEEEVKILERSVEELECTINVLEKKVYEMEDDVERHRLMRDSLELELQALRRRLLTVENFTENLDPGNSNIEPTVENQLSRSLELHEAQNRIRILEEERTGQAKEIKQLKEYVSELVLHAEAQASQYQQKYNTLEAMVREVKTDSSSHTSEAVTLHKTEKGATRTRGSSSPFRCISTLVHQMNLEKDQELSTAKIRIEELEESLASRQKEVCMLNTRLASAENMTHDVIRDLLGVKLDMTNYANIIDQYQLQRLVEATQQRSQESSALEEEILNLRRQIDHLSEERERCVSEVNRRESDILAAQMTIEQLHERDQLLSAQNEMLKKDKSNLKRRVAELDDMLKKLLGSQNNHLQTHQKITNLLRAGDTDLSRRLAHSEKLLSHVNDELAQFRKPESSHRHDQADVRGMHNKFRKHKA